MVAAPLDGHRERDGTLDPDDVADPRRRLRAVGDEAVRVSPHEPALARGQRRGLLPRRPTSARAGGARGLDARRERGRDRGRALLRHPSAARGVGGLDHRAAGRHVGPVLPPHGSRVPPSPRAASGGTIGLAVGRAGVRRARSDLEVHRDGPAAGPGDPRRVSAAPSRPPSPRLGGRRRVADLAREDSVRAAGGRHRRGGVPRPAVHRISHRCRAGGPGGDGLPERLVPRLEDLRAARPGPDLRAAEPAEPAREAVSAERGGVGGDDRRGLAPAEAMAGRSRDLGLLSRDAGAGERSRPHRQPSRSRSQHLLAVCRVRAPGRGPRGRGRGGPPPGLARHAGRGARGRARRRLDRRPRLRDPDPDRGLARLGDAVALRPPGRADLLHLQPQSGGHPGAARGSSPGPRPVRARSRATARPVRVLQQLRGPAARDGPAPGRPRRAPLPDRPGAERLQRAHQSGHRPDRGWTPRRRHRASSSRLFG